MPLNIHAAGATAIFSDTGSGTAEIVDISLLVNIRAITQSL